MGDYRRYLIERAETYGMMSPVALESLRCVSYRPYRYR